MLAHERKRRWLVPAITAGVTLILLLVFWSDLVAWFQPGRARQTEQASTVTPAEPSAPPTRAASLPELPDMTLPDERLAEVERALGAYEDLRAALAADRLAPEHARTVARWLGAASDRSEAHVKHVLTAGEEAAERLALADTLEKARMEFQTVSESLTRLVAADARLAEGMQVFECPMVDGFGKWLQPGGDLENPYMGQKMLSCGSRSTWETPEGETAGAVQLGHEGHGHAGDDVALYTCPMHPSIQSDVFGTCPICGMDLVPVTFDEQEGGVILVDEPRRQRIGVTTAPVALHDMDKTIRTVGIVSYDESRMHDVVLKYPGYIENLLVDETGQPVKRGQTLFTLYSPELYAAQLELIAAMNTRRQGVEGLGDSLVAAARRKLGLWDLTSAQIDAIVARDEPIRDVPFPSPASGFVIEKNVVQGSAVMAGQQLYRIAALDRIWIDADFYEADIGALEKGLSVTVSTPYTTGKTHEGEITYLYPYLDEQSRTLKARIELPNPELTLRPGMYADVTLELPLGQRLAVPEEAVLYTGPRRIVFVDVGAGRFSPRDVQLGVKADGYYEILSGLSRGDIVVTSGNFLLAAESRIRSAAYWGEGDDEEGGSDGGVHQH